MAGKQMFNPKKQESGIKKGRQRVFSGFDFHITEVLDEKGMHSHPAL